MEPTMEPTIHFCFHCGNRVVIRIPTGDNLPRHVCDHCGTIHYRNPRLVVGALPVWGDQVLLCRRAIEPRYGKWTLPAGFMENGETLAQAAVRETQEEANARIELEGLYTLIAVPHVSQVHVIYRASLLDTGFFAGDESLDVQLFNEADIPWPDIAFKTVEMTLRHFFSNRVRGEYAFLASEIPRPDQDQG